MADPAGSRRGPPAASAAHGRVMTGVPLSRLLVSRRSSFGFLRLTFAVLVVVDHAYPLGGFSGSPAEGIGVAGFFLISGFLVTRSWIGSPSVFRYLWHRVLRILPPFWACLMVTAFVFAPLSWHHEFGGFTGVFDVAGDGPLSYVRRNFFLQMNQYGISGLLLHTPFGAVSGGAWNGSMWTLIYEFRCYLILAGLGMAGILARHRLIVVVLTVGLYLCTVSWLIDPTWAGRLLPQLSDVNTVRFTFMFFLGSMCVLYADRLLIDDRLGAAALIVGVWSFTQGGWLVVGYPALSYCVIWLAMRLPFAGFNRPGDFSYGVYLYAFPIQMMLAQRNVQQYGLVTFIVASVVLSVVAGILSWHLLEKHTRKLRNCPSIPRRTSREHPHSLDGPARPVPAPAEPSGVRPTGAQGLGRCTPPTCRRCVGPTVTDLRRRGFARPG